ncbi:MAG TPA: MBL fold metallo-hydrolase [Actinomycetes bacterium]
MDIRVLETSDLGDRSYVVGAGDSVVVVDPQRDIDRLVPLVAGRTVTHVVETHIHNDYVTGGLQLAREHGAAYVVPAGPDVAYARQAAADGDTFASGATSWEAVATPGHTPHHLAWAVTDGAETAVLTGGSLLFGSVGRTDLVSDELTERLTRDQWRSARRLADRLPGSAVVLPTHGFGSFCSASPTSGDSSTIADQVAANPAFIQDEERFVAELVAGLDAYPAYYAQMAPLNLVGPGPVDLAPAAVATAADIRRRVDAGEWVVDLRSREIFAAGFVPGTLSFDSTGNVVTYLGWLIPWGTPVTLLGDSAEQVAGVQRELVRIGIDRPAAHAIGGPREWASDGRLATYPRTDFAGLAAALADDPGLTVLDVRSRSENRESRIAGARHVPLHQLTDRLDEMPDATLWVHCGSGFRAAVAASLLSARGRDVVHVDEDFEAAGPAGLPMVAGPAPDGE